MHKVVDTGAKDLISEGIGGEKWRSLRVFFFALCGPLCAH